MESCSQPLKLNYDVIIIGSGIGGLVAGTYLAKSGLRVLITERAKKPGGYCGSFEKDGFRFDEAVHYVNNMGSGGLLRVILEELGAYSDLRVIAVEPSDRLVTPNHEILIYRDWRKTADLLSNIFRTEEEGIEHFFSILSSFRLTALYEKYAGWTFDQLLRSIFHDERLITALSVFSTTLGLGPGQLSALAALAYYKGSILDGGYHVVGGAQMLTEALAKQFRAAGGELCCGSQVKRITIVNQNACGVELEGDVAISARIIISNADATQTYLNLVGEEHLSSDFTNKIRSLRPSLSMMAVYMGIKIPLKGNAPECCNLWYYPDKPFLESSLNITEDDSDDGYVHVGLSSLHDDTMAPKNMGSFVIFTGASFINLEYWQANRERLTSILLERTYRVLPKVRGNIAVSLTATPQTMYRYTLNRAGAYRGWETTPDQTSWGLLSEKGEIGGLFLASHWITTPVGNGGVSAVAYHGKQIAKSILKRVRTDFTLKK